MEENVLKKMDIAQGGEPALNLDKLQEQIAEIKTQMESLSKATPDNKISMIVFSGDLDKVLASFIIATGAVAMGMEVVMFFTFWGTPVLRDKMKKVGGKDMWPAVTSTPSSRFRRSPTLRSPASSCCRRHFVPPSSSPSGWSRRTVAVSC